MRNRVSVAVIMAAFVGLCVFGSGCASKEQRAARRLADAGQLLREKKVSDARAEIDEVIKSDPKNAKIYKSAIATCEKARAWAEAGRVREMLIKRWKALDLKPSMSDNEAVDTYMFAGDDYQNAHDAASAERVLKDGLATFPDNPTLLNALAYLYADQGIKLDEALSMETKIAKLAPNNPGVLDTLGWTQFKRGDLKPAAANLQRAVKIERHVAVVHYHLGAVYAKMGRKDDARGELNKALLLDSSLTEASELLKRLGEGS